MFIHIFIVRSEQKRLFIKIVLSSCDHILSSSLLFSRSHRSSFTIFFKTQSPHISSNWVNFSLSSVLIAISICAAATVCEREKLFNEVQTFSALRTWPELICKLVLIFFLELKNWSDLFWWQKSLERNQVQSNNFIRTINRNKHFCFIMSNMRTRRPSYIAQQREIIVEGEFCEWQ